jgi:hypothetical protein
MFTLTDVPLLCHLPVISHSWTVTFYRQVIGAHLSFEVVTQRRSGCTSKAEVSIIGPQ